MRRFITTTLRATTAASALSMSAMAVPVFAQTASTATAADAAPQLEEIIVTAQRRTENAQRVPITILTATPATLAAAGVVNIVQIERVAPGLQVYQTSGNLIPFLRGVGSSQSAAAFENPIAIYIDGVYQGIKGGLVQDLADIERIEVLKGPQGTLFGRNATGGAISIITRTPSFTETKVELEAGYGRFSEKRTKAYLSTPISSTLAVDASFTGRWDHGFIRNITLNKSANPATNMAGTAKMLWKPNEDFQATLSGSYVYFKDNTSLAQHPQIGTVPTAAVAGFATTYNDYETAADHDTTIYGKTSRATLDLRYDFGSVRLVSISGYIRNLAYGLTDSDNTAGKVAYAGVPAKGEEFSQEVQLQSTTTGPLNWILGAYYTRLKDGYPDGNNLVSASNLPFPIRVTDLTCPTGVTCSATGIVSVIRTKAYAAFGQATYEIATGTKITAGLRYNNETKTQDGTIFRYAAVPGTTSSPLFATDPAPINGRVFGRTTLVPPVHLSKQFSKLTWRLSIDQQLDNNVLAYASYNRGFKSGSYNITTVSPTQAALRPEVIDAYEVGIKSELFDRKLRLNVSAFYYNVKDLQVAFSSSFGISSVQNAAAARMYGLDFDLLASPVRNLQLRAGLNLLNSKYKSYSNASAVLPRLTPTCPSAATVVSIDQARAIGNTPVPSGVGGGCTYVLNATGLRTVFSPKMTGNFGGDYSIDAGEGKVVLNGSVYYNSGFDVIVGGVNGRVPSYESLSAGIAYHAPDDRYFVRIWGENLTNNHRAAYLSPQALVAQQVNVRPITYGITAGLKFAN